MSYTPNPDLFYTLLDVSQWLLGQLALRDGPSIIRGHKDLRMKVSAPPLLSDGQIGPFAVQSLLDATYGTDIKLEDAVAAWDEAVKVLDGNGRRAPAFRDCLGQACNAPLGRFGGWDHDVNVAAAQFLYLCSLSPLCPSTFWYDKESAVLEFQDGTRIGAGVWGLERRGETVYHRHKQRGDFRDALTVPMHGTALLSADATALLLTLQRCMPEMAPALLQVFSLTAYVGVEVDLALIDRFDIRLESSLEGEDTLPPQAKARLLIESAVEDPCKQLHELLQGVYPSPELSRMFGYPSQASTGAYTDRRRNKHRLALTQVFKEML
jgi:hypothetical protein